MGASSLSSTLRGNADAPLVSIIIPTLNSEATLRPTLKSIKNQTYPKVEVIIVDGYSKDSTVSIAREFTSVDVYQVAPDRSSQVNLGVSNARGEYIYRVDSDFVLDPTVVEEALEQCRRGANAVLIHNTSDPTISIWSKARKLERDCYRDESIHVAVRFMRKVDFEKAGGFLEDLATAEDYDLHNRLLRLGIRIGRIGAEEVHIGEPRNLRDVILKHVYYGTQVRAFLKSNPKTGWRQITPFRLAYLRHWRDFTKDPVVTAAFLFYQYVRYASAVVGSLSGILG